MNMGLSFIETKVKYHYLSHDDPWISNTQCIIRPRVSWVFLSIMGGKLSLVLLYKTLFCVSVCVFIIVLTIDICTVSKIFKTHTSFCKHILEKIASSL